MSRSKSLCSLSSHHPTHHINPTYLHIFTHANYSTPSGPVKDDTFMNNSVHIPLKPIKLLANMLQTQRYTFELRNLVLEQAKLIQKEIRTKADANRFTFTPRKELLFDLVKMALQNNGRVPNPSERMVLAEKHKVHPITVKRLAYLMKEVRPLDARMHRAIDQFLSDDKLERMSPHFMRKLRANLPRQVNFTQLQMELSKRMYPTARERQIMDEYLRTHYYLPPPEDDEEALVKTHGITPLIKLRHYFYNRFKEAYVPLSAEVANKAEEWLQSVDHRLPTHDEIESLAADWNAPVNRVAYTLLKLRQGNCQVDEQELERLLFSHLQRTGFNKVYNYRYQVIGLLTGCDSELQKDVANRLRFGVDDDIPEEILSFLEQWSKEHTFPPTPDQWDHIHNETNLNKFQVMRLVLSIPRLSAFNDASESYIEKQWQQNRVLNRRRSAQLSDLTGWTTTRLRQKFNALTRQELYNQFTPEMHSIFREWMLHHNRSPSDEEIQNFCVKYNLHRSNVLKRIYSYNRVRRALNVMPQEKAHLLREYMRNHGSVPRYQNWPKELEIIGGRIGKHALIPQLRTHRKELIQEMAEKMRTWIKEHEGAKPDEAQIQQWIQEYPGFEREIRDIGRRGIVTVKILPFTDEEMAKLREVCDKYQGDFPLHELQRLAREFHRSKATIEAWIRNEFPNISFRRPLVLHPSLEAPVREWLTQLGRKPQPHEVKEKAQELYTPQSAIRSFYVHSFDKSAWKLQPLTPEVRKAALDALKEHGYEYPPVEVNIALVDKFKVRPRSITAFWQKSIERHRAENKEQ